MERGLNMSSPIAIVGIGCRFAGARDPQSFWEVTREGRAVFGPVPPGRWDEATFFDANPRARDKSYAPTGAWIDDVETFPAQALQIPPRRVDVMDPQQRLSLECAIEAIEDAGMNPDALPRRTGVYMGVTAVEYRTLSSARVVAGLMASGALGQAPADADEAAVIARAVERVVATRPYTAPGVLSNMVAATVAQELRLHGPAFTTDAACASSLVAMHSAVLALRAGQIDAALAGGVYVCLTPEHHVAFSRIGAISKSGVCRPFDQRADGFVQGDGCGVVMLKRLADAERDGDRIYGLIHGIAMNNDGGGAGPMAPVKEGQVEVIRAAWDDAGLSPEALGYIESHGTGTLVGDHIEFDGLTEALGTGLSRAGIGSTKANFGHTMSAAGICGVIRATLALWHETLPPMANFESPKPDLPLEGSALFIPKAAQPWTSDGRLACVSSFGFGGTNGHVVLGEAPKARATITATSAAGAVSPVARTEGEAELFLMSAPDAARLRRLASETARSLRGDARATLAGAVRAWQKRRRQAERLAIVARTKDELIASLESFAAGELPKGVLTGTAPENTPKLAFVFPGQGAQRVGMLAGIRDRFPRVRAALDAMDAASEGVMPRPVTHYLYPERRPEVAGGVFDTDAMNAELTETDNCQPALFAVGHALSELLASVGVRPSVVAGHSVGEFTAAAVAGMTSPEDGLRWCARRGQGMQALGGDKGAMAAIVADVETARAVLAEGTVIANINHPRQVVVSGFQASVRATVEAARARGLEVTELRVSHGFHSGVFADLNLDATVDGIAFTDGTVPVASCIAEAAYTDPATANAVYKRHARSPVDWVGALQRCREAGAELFVQVAAGGPLLSFIRGTLPGVPAISIASRDDTDGGASFLEGLGQLFVHGVDVDPSAITAPAELASLPASILPRERYWIVSETRVEALPDFGGRVGAQKVRDAAPARAETPKAAPIEAPAAAAPAAPGQDGKVDPKVEIVFAAVAKASAYPRAALRPAMKLGDDLGFDSMMVADFVEELRKQIPGFSGIPQEVLVNQPTIQTIVDFVLSPEAMAESGAASADDDNLPLRTFRPAFKPATLPAHAARRAVVPGRFHRSGPAADAVATKTAAMRFAEHLVALGWKEVCEVSAANPDKGLDLLLLDDEGRVSPPISAVLAGEAPAPAGLTAAADAIFRGRFGERAGDGFDVIHTFAADDPWAASLSGLVRSLAREWPDRAVRNVALSGDDTTRPAQLEAELLAVARDADVALDGASRLTAGLDVDDAERQSFQPAPGERIVITGGTRGIGLLLAERLAGLGAEVTVLGRGAPAGLPSGVTAIAADVTDRAATLSALSGLSDVTTVIHAAGVLADGPLGRVPSENAQKAWDVKVTGLLNVVAALGASVTRVLGIGSWAGRFGNRHQAAYGAANAQLAAVIEALPARIAGTTAEFGPWTDSDMVRSIPPAVQAAMRAEGVDFTSNDAGILALMQDLGQAGIRVHGRRLGTNLHRALRAETVDVASHPYLPDHAIAGTPVFPLASATSFLAEAAGLPHPFEIRELRLFQGVRVDAPRHLEARVQGEKAELFQRAGEGAPVLSYRAEIGAASIPDLPPALEGGAPAPIPLSAFYGGITFHGPQLQGITAIDGVGPGFVRGRVRTAKPEAWTPSGTQAAFAVDPLAFDSAMQMAALVAYARWSRAGTPIGFDRYVQLKSWPAGEVIAEARFADAETETLSADLVFRAPGTGEVIAAAWGVKADMKKVEKAATPTPEKAAAAPSVTPPFTPREEWYKPSKFKGYKDISMRLQAVGAMGLKNPYFDLHEGTARNTSIIEGREIINYSSYNYLGLSGDPRVIAEVEAAIRLYGTSVSASRVASGERPFHRALEAALAKAHGCEDALVMAGGHATNVNTIGHLFGPKDLVLHDELIHDSCLQGIKLSGAARRSFRHEDIAHLEAQLIELRPHYEKVLILVEGVYSMDGDITNLPEYVRLKRAHGCMLMVDEAHSFGTVGATGCGVGEYWGMDETPARGGLLRSDVDIWMGTMSKSLASMGGWVAGSKELILYLRYTTPGFVFAAGIPPALGQAALSSLNYMLAEPWRVRDLQRNSKRFWELLKARDLDTGPSFGDSPVIPVITGDSMWALKLSERLLDQGINAKPIIFPAVANDAARLRFFMTSLHTEEQLVYTADCIQKTLAAIRDENPLPKRKG